MALKNAPTPRLAAASSRPQRRLRAQPICASQHAQPLAPRTPDGEPGAESKGPVVPAAAARSGDPAPAAPRASVATFAIALQRVYWCNQPAAPPSGHWLGGLLAIAAKVAFVDQLLAAKAASGKSFDDIAAECGWTNAYTAQLFFNQVCARVNCRNSWGVVHAPMA